MSRVWASLLLLIPLTVSAEPVRVDGVRVWEAPDSTRIVFDISGPVEHSVFTLSDPDRIVVDIDAAKVAGPFPSVGDASRLLRGLRTGKRNDDDLRLVLDLSGPANPRSFVLRPNDTYGHRLVVDLVPPARSAQARTAPVDLRELVIAIDAGHGGKDPGAIGPSGVREKDVVYAIARQLQGLIDAQPGMRALMVRSGDTFVSHGERIARARAARADLFVSIHADAFHDRRANGSSVYVLSERGATSEAARLLAERENASDLVGGVKLDDKDDMLASVLLDLSQTGVIGASRTFGEQVITELEKIGRVHKRDVQAANFLVLKAPDVPSVLVETAFISNPGEEARLRDVRHQQSLALSLLYGIRAYFADHAPPGTLVAVNGLGPAPRRVEHVIARGDTLSEIARRYNVSLNALRSSNDIASDRIRVGDVLLIPSTGG